MTSAYANYFAATILQRSVLSLILLLGMVGSAPAQSLVANPQIAATADATTPLQAGDEAPQFSVETVGRESYDFDPRHLERPVILIVFRGGWCPYCNMHLSELRHVVPEISEMGIDVLFVSGDRPELLYDSLEAGTRDDIDGLNYVILSDADANAAIALGIAFVAPDVAIRRRHEKGDDIDGSSMALHGILPVPSVFAIDTQGIIRFVYSNPDYKVRLPAGKLLEVATAMVGHQSARERSNTLAAPGQGGAAQP